MLSLLAQHANPLAGWSFPQMLVTIIIVAACCGIAMVAMRKFNIAVPDWAVQIFWIVLVACVAILAIRFVSTL